MSDKDSKPAAEPRQPGEPKQSGRVAYDSKGNPIWEWETSTGVYNRDVSTQRLKKLEAELSLEATQPVPKPKLVLQESERLPGGGINPYDTSGSSPSRTAPAKHPALAHKQIDHSNAPRRSLLSKYANTPLAKKPPQSFWQRLKAKLERGK